MIAMICAQSHILTLVMVPCIDNPCYDAISKTLSAEDGLEIREYLQYMG